MAAHGSGFDVTSGGELFLALECGASGDKIVWLRGFGVHLDFVATDGIGILISEEPLVNEG